MAILKPKRSRDLNKLASAVVRAVTEGESVLSDDKTKNPHAVALGKLGGSKGGKTRAMRMTAKERSESAKKAVEARWKKYKLKKKLK